MKTIEIKEGEPSVTILIAGKKFHIGPFGDRLKINGTDGSIEVHPHADNSISIDYRKGK